MKILIFDIEHATCKDGRFIVCEFGYALFDEYGKLIENNNLLINPQIKRSEWDWYVRKNILTKPIEVYEKQPFYNAYFDRIQKMILDADYIIGHSPKNDLCGINFESKRYNLPCLDFVIYDTNVIYKKYAEEPNNISLSNMMKSLNITFEGKEHDAEYDSICTGLCLFSMVKTEKISFREFIKKYDKYALKNENFNFKSLLPKAKKKNDSKDNRKKRIDSSNKAESSILELCPKLKDILEEK